MSTTENWAHAPRVRKSSLTEFGLTYNNIRETTNFKSVETAGSYLTKSQVEQISRMSRHREAIAGMSDEARGRIIDGVAGFVIEQTLTGMFKGTDLATDIVLQERFRGQIRNRLQSAINRDLEILENTDVANLVGLRLAELTNRSLRQLLLEIESSDGNVQTFIEKLNPVPKMNS